MKLKILFSLLFVLVMTILHAQDLNTIIPVDSNMKVGKLSNGLTYIIRKNNKPEQKAIFRLIINAGSILESNNQLGLAHFVEHMAFNGTKHFKKNDIVSYLQTIGVRFGADLNAYTTFDETVYMLPIPLDNPKNLDNAFLIMQDWAKGITFNENDVNNERAIILEEERLGKGAQERMLKVILPAFFAHSLYADRLPIGKDTIIKNCTANDLKQFYREWYRPDLMSIVVVGDINVKDIENRIKKTFSSLKNPSPEKPRIYPIVSPYKHTFGMVATDSEATSNVILFNYSSQKRQPQKTWNDYKNDLIKNILFSIINQRFQDKAQVEFPPYLYATFGISPNSRQYENPTLSIILSPTDDLNRAIVTVMQELNKIKKFGVTPQEVDVSKSSIISVMEKLYKEQGKTESSNYINEYTRFFLDSEPSPGIAAEYHFVQHILPTIDTHEVNKAIDIIRNDTNMFIGFLGVPSLKTLNVDSFISIVDSLKNMNVQAFVEKQLSTNILADTPLHGSIIKQVHNDSLGTTELMLSNGVNVILKKTDFKNDEILISGIRRGGKSEYIKRDLINATYTNAVNPTMGIAQFTPDDWNKMNAGRNFNISFSLENLTDHWVGYSSTKDLPYCFQTIYLMSTTIPQDTILFKSYINKLRGALPTLKNDPANAFIDTMTTIFYHNSPYVYPMIPTESQLQQIDIKKILAMYKEHINNMSNMTFVIVGSFNEDSIKNLITTYLGRLPTSNKYFDFVDNQIRPIQGKNNFDYYKGIDNKSIVVYKLYGEIPYTEDLNLKMNILEKAVNIRLLNELRENLQGAYTINVQGELQKFPYSSYDFSVIIPCAPENTLRLWKIAQTALYSMAIDGPTNEELLKAKEELLQQYKENLTQNSFWVNILINDIFPYHNPQRALHADLFINAIDKKDIQKTAQLFFNSHTNIFRATLYPEK